MNVSLAFPGKTLNPLRKEEMREILLDPQDEWIREQHAICPSYRGNRIAMLCVRHEGVTWNLARLILRPPDNLWADHISGDIFDDRRANLRMVTPQQNQFNKRGFSRSGFKGVNVCDDSRINPYKVSVTYMGKSRYIGSYPTAEDAAKAYDDAVRLAHKGYGRVNYPLYGEQQA
jgi:hypothetical protein